MGSAEPPGKMDEKLKSENMQKEQFLNGRWGWGRSDTSDDWLVKLMMIIIVIVIDHYPSSQVSLFLYV